ncbi:MAG: glyoxalase superfamily protein [Bradyrhizobium sp.]|nr:glyoxalase superfamily protein [Bradyrhizobium sp.]
MTAQFLRTVPVLRMFDVAKAREFYLDFLGCQVDFEHRFAPDLPLFMQLRLGDVVLRLSEHHGGSAPGARVTIEMTGLAPYHAELLAKQYRYARPGLVEQPWGATTMTIADPFYNHIEFSERTG